MLVAGTAVAAVAVGAVIAVAVNVARESQQTATQSTSLPQPSPTALSTATRSPTPSELTGRASATGDAIIAPAPTPASHPASTPTAAPVIGGGTGSATAPVYDVTGTWEALAPMPGGEEFATADSIVLPDGRIAAFRWNRGGEPSNDFVVYDPAADAWRPVVFNGERPSIGTDQAFGLGGDGRIYTHDYRIDPSGDEWRVESFQLVRETDVWAGMPLTGGADGRIYRAADDTSSQRTELIAYDPIADTFSRSSDVSGNYDVIVRADKTLLLFGSHNDEAQLIEYDPAGDTWSAPHPAIGNVAEQHAAVVDGRLYVPGFYPDTPQLWALSLADDMWRSVQLPQDAEHWAVDLLLGPDGRLYAFERERVWAFTPDD